MKQQDYKGVITALTGNSNKIDRKTKSLYSIIFRYLSLLLLSHPISAGPLGELFKVPDEKLKMLAEVHCRIQQEDQAHPIYKQLLQQHK